MEFVDTNVLVYAASRAPEDEPKSERAKEILSRRDLCLSVQVLQEFYVQVTRATRTSPLTHEQAVGLVESFLRFPVADATVSIVRASLLTRERFQISYWDVAIIEAARSLGCDVVLSEDLAHGQDYGGIRVENPFRQG